MGRPVQTCAAILSSGRALRIVKPTTSMLLDVAERHQEGSAKFAKALLGKCIQAVTLQPVAEVLAEDQTADEEAMVLSVDAGAGGGWVPVSEVDFAEKGGPRSFDELFEGEPTDFGDATRLVMAAMRPPQRGAARTGKIVRSVMQ